MAIDKSKLKEPANTEDNREILAETILNDMSTKEKRERIKEQLISSYRNSNRSFLKEYWDYYEETYGHCPFRLNSD
jgi:RNA polymerase-binding transcription factor DksA